MIPLFDNGHKKLSLEQSWCHAKLCPVSLLMLFSTARAHLLHLTTSGLFP
jgi:uncharacterized membrane protein